MTIAEAVAFAHQRESGIGQARPGYPANWNRRRGTYGQRRCCGSRRGRASAGRPHRRFPARRDRRRWPRSLPYASPRRRCPFPAQSRISAVERQGFARTGAIKLEDDRSHFERDIERRRTLQRRRERRCIVAISVVDRAKTRLPEGDIDGAETAAARPPALARGASIWPVDIPSLNSATGSVPSRA